MKRIDSVNARADVNGIGKAGFHDNADLEGQDATYLTPEFMNMIQEELANLLEKNGEDLDPNSNAQLYEILATKAGLTEFLKQAEILLKQQDENNELAIKDVLDKLKKLSKEIGTSDRYNKVGGTTVSPRIIMVLAEMAATGVVIMMMVGLVAAVQELMLSSIIKTQLQKLEDLISQFEYNKTLRV